MDNQSLEITDSLRDLFAIMKSYRAKNEFASRMPDDYFEPGNMEYLDQYDGEYDQKTGEMCLCFEVKGTRYEGRTEYIEQLKPGDCVSVIREEDNAFNSNNFTLDSKRNIGNMPADLCNAIAPLYDAKQLSFVDANVSFVEPISKRSRYAKQAVLFVRIRCQLNADYVARFVEE